MRYLSDEWLAEVGARAEAVTVPPADDGPALVIQTVVTDGPDGEVAFHLELTGSTLAVRAGRAPAPTVTFTQTFRTANEVASGRRSAQAAFMAGDIRLGGDVTALIEHRDRLATFDEVMAAVAASTEFADTSV